MTRRTLSSIIVLGLLLGACGDGPSDNQVLPTLPDKSTNTTMTDRSADPRAVALSFSECMRANGVEKFPDPVFNDAGEYQFGVGDKDDPNLAPATKTCLPLLDAVPEFGKSTDPEEVAAQQERSLALARCLRAAGFDVPDPVFDDSGRSNATLPPPAAPGFADAVKKCALEISATGGTTP